MDRVPGENHDPERAREEVEAVAAETAAAAAGLDADAKTFPRTFDVPSASSDLLEASRAPTLSETDREASDLAQGAPRTAAEGLRLLVKRLGFPRIAALIEALFLISLTISLVVGWRAQLAPGRPATLASPPEIEGVSQTDGSPQFESPWGMDGSLGGSQESAQGGEGPGPGTTESLATGPPQAIGGDGAATPQSRFVSPNPPPPGAPLLAIVIDDWGYGWKAAADFLAFDRPLTVAILPHLPLSRAHAQEAHERGHQVILHLPMEPLAERWDLSEGTVTTAMASDEIEADVRAALASVPHISGVNNHMGSKATADPRVVADVLKTVKEEGLFFLDSRTTAESVVAVVARELGVRVLENDRFIDPDTDAQRVKERILLAARLAKRRGYAIAIGHVRPETYQGLIASLPEIDREGVYLAYLSDVLERVYPEPHSEGIEAGEEPPPPVDGAIPPVDATDAMPGVDDEVDVSNDPEVDPPLTAAPEHSPPSTTHDETEGEESDPQQGRGRLKSAELI